MAGAGPVEVCEQPVHDEMTKTIKLKDRVLIFSLTMLAACSLSLPWVPLRPGVSNNRNSIDCESATGSWETFLMLTAPALERRISR